MLKPKGLKANVCFEMCYFCTCEICKCLHLGNEITALHHERIKRLAQPWHILFETSFTLSVGSVTAQKEVPRDMGHFTAHATCGEQEHCSFSQKYCF